MRTIAIAVNREDIRGATRRDPSYCPIARAIHRRLTTAYSPLFHLRHATVRPTLIVIADEGITPPADVSSKIYDYDDGDPMFPFSFSLEVSDATALLFSQPLALKQ